MKSIVVSVTTEGATKIEAIGFTGKACEQSPLGQAIEKALGISGKKTRKPEFFQGNQQQAKAGL